MLICDDHDDLRCAVTDVLSFDPRFDVVGEATDAQTCLVALRTTDPDVLLLDYNLPGGGPELARAARVLMPDLYILVFSVRTPAGVENDMLAAGANAYLVKTGRVGPLLAAMALARAAISARPSRYRAGRSPSVRA